MRLANTKNILHRKTHYCRYNQRQICTQYLERQKPNQKNINKNKIKLYSILGGGNFEVSPTLSKMGKGTELLKGHYRKTKNIVNHKIDNFLTSKFWVEFSTPSFHHFQTPCHNLYHGQKMCLFHNKILYRKNKKNSNQSRGKLWTCVCLVLMKTNRNDCNCLPKVGNVFLGRNRNAFMPKS